MRNYTDKGFIKLAEDFGRLKIIGGLGLMDIFVKAMVRWFYTLLPTSIPVDPTVKSQRNVKYFTVTMILVELGIGCTR